MSEQYVISIDAWRRHKNLVQGYTTRALGNLSYRSGEHEEADIRRQQMAHELKIEESRMFSIPLGHTNRVAVLKDDSFLSRLDERGYYEPSPDETVDPPDLTPEVYDRMPKDRNYVDGVVFNVPEVYSLIITADCAAVGFYDPVTGVCGNAHVGLLGVVNQLPRAMVEVMTDEFGCEPATVEATIFPCIRKCHYDTSRSMTWQNIKEDMFAAYGEGNPLYMSGYFDLPGFIRLELLEAGVPEGNIFDSGLCTVCHSDQFYSHVGAGTSEAQAVEGRFGAVVGVRG